MRLEEEKRQAEQKLKETEEQKLYSTVKVSLYYLKGCSLSFWLAQMITEQSFHQHEGFDLATFDDNKSSPPSGLLTFRVLKQDPYSKFKAQVAEKMNLPVGSVRLWVMANRQNKTIRPDVPIPDNDTGLSKDHPIQ
jgi:ubiquitin carboxyl-terminal hydrolase 7